MIDTAPSSDASFVAQGLDQLATAHYGDLLRLARRERRRVRDMATLDTHAVLHETFLRLAGQRQEAWADRPRFLAAAASMMRRVLIDYLRQRHALKRGGSAHATITLEDAIDETLEQDLQLLALDEALDALARFAPRLAQVVECRFFGGMTEAETAVALDVTERTVRRDWVKARGWLHREIEHPGRA